MKKTGIVMAVLASAMISAPAWAQHIKGSLHDLSSRLGTGEICLSCHVTHNAMTAATLVNGTAVGTLWNHALTGGGTNSIGTGTGFTSSNGTKSKTLYSNSVLCMGCHDGVTAVGNFGIVNPSAHGAEINATLTLGALIAGFPVTGSNPANVIGLDFTNMHPVGVAYPGYGGATTSFNAASPTPGSYPAGGYSLGGGAGIVNLEYGKTSSTQFDTVGCSTCHNPHDNTYVPFLVMSNQGSALCLQCHIR
jgi:predicted CXXCH cytochrome family protein